MSKPDFKILADAHIVCGALRGTSEAISFWKPDEVTQGMIDRAQAFLADLHAKSERVANFISELAEGEGK